MHAIDFEFVERLAAYGALALAFIGTTSWIRQARLDKEMERRERLKAMEMGLVPPPAGLSWPAAAVCIAIGAGVPIGSFLVAWLAVLTADVPAGVFVAPVFVSLSAVSAARKLAYRVIDPKSAAKTPSFAQSKPAGKPEFDPDAYDVVGSRG